jgi:hypothetical protein
MMENLGNENSDIVTGRQLQTALKLRITHRRTNLLQGLQYFKSETQDDSELFPRLSNNTTVKIILRVIRRVSFRKWRTEFNLFLLWGCDPTRVVASSFLWFLDHAQRRTTIGRTPLDE